MIRCVMIRLCGYLLWLSACALHVALCYLLLGLAATLVIVGVQLLIAAEVVYMRIRTPD